MHRLSLMIHRITFEINHTSQYIYSSSTCGLLQDRLLLINYSKHIYWIFIKGLIHTEVCLCALVVRAGLRILNRIGQHGLNSSDLVEGQIVGNIIIS
jgi:hypothetical protein